MADNEFELAQDGMLNVAIRSAAQHAYRLPSSQRERAMDNILSASVKPNAVHWVNAEAAKIRQMLYWTGTKE